MGLHHAMHIRWDAWKDDAVLQDREKILDWLSERGVTGPREKREADKRRAAAEEEAMDRWRAAVPECLHSLGDRVFGGDLTPLQTALETALPDVSDTRARHSRMVWSGKGGDLEQLSEL